MKRPGEWKCSVEGCDATGVVRDGEVWRCAKHEKADQREKHLKSMREAYTQTIYMNYVAKGSALDELGPEAARRHLRWLKAQAKLAAEVLFEEEP